MTDGCWCMWWRQRTGNRERNKQAMKELVDGGREPGLLAYESAVPVGWVSIGPREEFGQLVRSRIYRPVDEEPGAWSIVCFYVHPSAKRHRVATALLGAAVEHALTRGARAIEAYPRDQPDYMGVKTSLERLGFEAARPAGKRTVMRRAIRPSRRK